MVYPKELTSIVDKYIPDAIIILHGNKKVYFSNRENLSKFDSYTYEQQAFSIIKKIFVLPGKTLIIDEQLMLTYLESSVGNVKLVGNKTRLFYCNKVLTSDLTSWDISSVTNMKSMFEGSHININVSNWDTSSVTSMRWCFYKSDFNGDISQWNVGRVQDMNNAFAHSNFNGDISRWDTRNVHTMECMFCNNKVFNQDISNWDTASVLCMALMFKDTCFNQDISNWDTTSVQTMVC